MVPLGLGTYFFCWVSSIVITRDVHTFGYVRWGPSQLVHVSSVCWFTRLIHNNPQKIGKNDTWKICGETSSIQSIHIYSILERIFYLFGVAT